MQAKRDLVASISEEIKNSSWIFFINYKGLNAADMSSLRSSLRKNNAKMIVNKNKLSLLALKEAGFPLPEVAMAGQNAMVITSNVVDAAKVIGDFITDGKVQILYYSDSEKLYDASSLMTLSKLPSLEVLQAKLLSALKGPASSLVRLANEPAASLVRVLNAYSEAKN